MKIGARSWIADGRLDIEDVEEALDLTFPRALTRRSGASTWLWPATSRSRATSVVESVRLTVLQMDRNRIGRLRIELPAGRGII